MKKIAASGDADLRRLCELVEENYGYPVDSVLVTPDLRVVGHKNVNDAMFEGATPYLGLLKRGLAMMRGEELSEEEPDPGHSHGVESTANEPRPPGASLELTPDHPSGELLDVMRAAAGGPMQRVPAFYPLDITGFEEGTIEIRVSVGSSLASGTFQLCELIDDGRGHVYLQEVVSADDVPPVGKDKIVHRFQSGQSFQLAVLGTGDEGQVNAFRAEVTVIPR
ncbi:MAG: hypothetical protein RL885_28345 [Planctomycetota bacterium]